MIPLYMRLSMNVGEFWTWILVAFAIGFVTGWFSHWRRNHP